MADGILVPGPGIEPVPPALEAWSLNHWTAREVLGTFILDVEEPSAPALGFPGHFSSYRVEPKVQVYRDQDKDHSTPTLTVFGSFPLSLHKTLFANHCQPWEATHRASSPG